MKKYILTLLLITSTFAAQAQWKIGQAKKSIDYYNLSVEEGANYIYSDEVLYDVDSYDEASAYPYVMVTRKF